MGLSYLFSPRRALKVPTGLRVRRCLLVVLLACGANATALGAVATTGDIIFVTDDTGVAPGWTVNESVNVLDVTFFVEFLADVGSRTITNTSRFQAEFPAVLNGPGNAHIELSQIPVSSEFTNSSGLKGSIGARYKPPWLPTLEVSEGLGGGVVVNGAGDGSLTSIHGSDNDVFDPAPTFGIPYGILSASAGIRWDVSETVDYAAIDGRLLVDYTEPDGTYQGFIGGLEDLHLESSWTPQSFDVDLLSLGTYGFYLVTPKITGTIETDEVTSVSVFATVFGNDLEAFRIPIVPLNQSANFEAESNVEIIDWFSVEVRSQQPGVVPEPSTLAIWSLLGALRIMVGWRRHRSRYLSILKTGLCRDPGIV